MIARVQAPVPDMWTKLVSIASCTIDLLVKNIFQTNSIACISLDE